jgi:O-antigen/teichoic acid export membrane protein
MYLDRFLIGSLLSLAAVSYYTAPYEVVIRLWILPTSLVMTLFPAFSAFGATQGPNLGRLYVRSVKYLALLMGPVVLTLVLLANGIVRLWLGPDFGRESTLVFQILCMGALVGCLAPIPGSLLQGLGRPDLLSKLYLVELPLNLPLVWFLTKYMGINGAALSFMLRTVIETVVLMYLSSRLVPTLPRHFVRRTGLYLLLVLSALILTTQATPWLAKTPVLLWVTTATLVALLIFGTWRFLLNRDEKKDLASAAREAFAMLTATERRGGA